MNGLCKVSVRCQDVRWHHIYLGLWVVHYVAMRNSHILHRLLAAVKAFLSHATSSTVHNILQLVQYFWIRQKLCIHNPPTHSSKEVHNLLTVIKIIPFRFAQACPLNGREIAAKMASWPKGKVGAIFMALQKIVSSSFMARHAR